MFSANNALLGGCALSLASSAFASDVVGFEFTRNRVNARDVPHLESRYPHLARRAATVQVEITNEILLYLINVTVGTPPQPISLQLDTGSSDVWFPAAQADICQQQPAACSLGTYDLTSSSTGIDLAQGGFQIQYVDGSTIQGDYISDVLSIGSTQLTNTTMAAATTASRGIGIMGIGYQAGESLAETQGLTYPDVINELVNQGKISSLAYSLWLDDVNTNTGSILFGGVDASKYTGNLVGLPIQLDSQTGNLTSFTVAWTGLTSDGGGSTQTYMTSSTAIPAILDSGTTNMLLPDDIANNIYNAVGVITDPNYGNIVPCDLANDDMKFTFTFGGPQGATVKVSLSEFVTPLLTVDGSTAEIGGKTACTFAVESAGSNPILLGDSFLRSAYVVYDLHNNMIGLGQTNFKGGSSNIKEITNSGIPGVSSTASAVTVQQTFSGYPLQTAGATGTAVGSTVISRSATVKLTTVTSTAGSSSGSSSSAISGSGSIASSSSSSSAGASSSPSPVSSAAGLATMEQVTGFASVVTIACFLFGSVAFWM